MQAYSEGFARLYNIKWSRFASQVAPLILDFYAATPIGQQSKSVLDVCCGTGQLALHFLEKGYRVVGLDLSGHMLTCAKENARLYIEAGQAEFVQADATNFKLQERFGLVVSTFDAINHLEDEQCLKKCLQCVHAVNDGYFIFDLNTRSGLRRWNGIEVDDSSDNALIITRGIFDGQGERAVTRITGFVQRADASYERIDETVFNTVFEMEMVKDALLAAGWKKVYFARMEDLKTPLTLAEAEKQGRVFVVASR